MTVNKTAAGKESEDLVAGFLVEQGYRIICRNYRASRAEIDIIAMDRETICFVEVRGRNGPGFGEPEESITRVKRAKVSSGAIEYLKAEGLLERKARFDVVCVRRDGGQRRIKLIKDAFELEGDF